METTKTIILRKSFHIVSTLLFYAVIFSLLLFTVANMNVRKTSDIAHVFGSGFHSIEKIYNLDSQNNRLTSKDIALVKMVDEQLILELKIGDVITFYDDQAKQLVTHQITEIETLDDTLYFMTLDDTTTQEVLSVEAENVIGVYQSSILGLGTLLDYLQTPEGFLVFVILPVIAMIIFESFHLFHNLQDYRKTRSEVRINKMYKKILKNLESETNRIRHQIMSNWMTEVDYQKITRLRM